jgi:hypothetical protein
LASVKTLPPFAEGDRQQIPRSSVGSVITDGTYDNAQADMGCGIRSRPARPCRRRMERIRARVVLTEPQLQERINRQLPREFRGVTVERATVSLADGRVSLHVEARATALGQAFAAAAFARGVPRYNAEGGEIFFDAEDVRLENFQIDTGSLAERAQRLGARLGGRVGEAVEQNLPRIQSAASTLIAAGVKAFNFG